MRSAARRRAALVVVVGLLLAGGAALFLFEDDEAGGGGDGGGEPALTGDQALLTGKVVDAKTKAPLAGARLLIDQEGGRITVLADSKGHYRRVINASRPIGFTADAPDHQGTAGFGRICPGERRRLDLELPPAGNQEAPPAPLVIKGDC